MGMVVGRGAAVPGPLAQVLDSARAEWLKLRYRPAVWLLGILLCGGILTFGYLLVYLGTVILARTPPAEGGPPPDLIVRELRAGLVPGALLGQVIPLLSTLGGPIGLILGALTLGGEYGWGTLKTILTQRPGRLALVGGKLLALAPLLLLFSLGAFVVGLLGSVAIAALLGESLAPPAALDLLKGVGAGWLILAVWTTFGVALATLFRSAALAIGLGLIYSLVLESVVSGVALFVEAIDTARRFLLGANAGALASYFGGSGSTIPPERATLVLVLYLVVFVALTLGAVRARDVE